MNDLQNLCDNKTKQKLPKHPAVGIWESWWYLKKKISDLNFLRAFCWWEGYRQTFPPLGDCLKLSTHGSVGNVPWSYILDINPKFNAHQIRLFWIHFWNILVRAKRENWVFSFQESRSGVPWSPSRSCHIINYFMWGSLEVHTVIEFGVQMFIGINLPVWWGRWRSWIVTWVCLGSANLGVSGTHDNPGWSQAQWCVLLGHLTYSILVMYGLQEWGVIFNWGIV